MLRGNLLPYFLILFLCAARAPRFLSSRVTGEEDCPTRFSLLIPEGKRCVDTVHPCLEWTVFRCHPVWFVGGINCNLPSVCPSRGIYGCVLPFRAHF